MPSDTKTQKPTTAPTNGTAGNGHQQSGPKTAQISGTITEELHSEIAALVGPRYKTTGLALAVILYKGLQVDGPLTKEEIERYELARQLTGQDGA